MSVKVHVFERLKRIVKAVGADPKTKGFTSDVDQATLILLDRLAGRLEQLDFSALEKSHAPVATPAGGRAEP